MPFITRPLTPRTRPSAQITEVHKELVALGLPIANAERKAKRFGTETAAAVKSLQKRYGLSETGSVDPPTGRVMHVASLFASSDDRTELRTALRKAVPAATAAQPQELYWLARYSVIIRDYETAKKAVAKAPGYDPIVTEIEPIIALPGVRPTPPEVQHPENFYSFYFDLVDPSLIQSLKQSLLTVTAQDADGPNNGPTASTGAELMQATGAWLEAIEQWQFGYREITKRRFDSAILAFRRGQEATIRFFANSYPFINSGSGSADTRLANVYERLRTEEDRWPHLWETLRLRRTLLSLNELWISDWGSDLGLPANALDFIKQFLHQGEFEPINGFRSIRSQLVIYSTVLRLAVITIPLARAEANRLRRQHNAAVAELKSFHDSQLNMLPRFRIACEFIELPFARLMMSESLLDKADAEYKAQIPADPPADPNNPGPVHSDYQGLRCAETYLQVAKPFENDGDYLTRVQSGRDQLEAAIRSRRDAEDTQSQSFQILGKDITVPTISGSSDNLPGLDPHTGPHESLLAFKFAEGESSSETNPRVYAILLTAQARLEQLRAQFNWLGYRDDYVPPWRFPFLLERARYFAEHAKNAQREYLNFLSNAEREEFQELTTAQNVEMEKSNVRIETARVDQVQLEAQAANESLELTQIQAANADARLTAYTEMDGVIDDLEAESSFWGFIGGGIAFVAGVAAAPVTGGASLAVAIGGYASLVSQTMQREAENGIANVKRENEKFNLWLNTLEAKATEDVARSQLDVALAGILVAGLQRQVALIRHEFAIQNLNFLRNRTLNTEQWYRLVAGIRSVSETYLRYAVALSFLAEQAYEFEMDKRINVIRFDYDISELGDMLAADFLLRDLDTLEQDLIVNQRLRQQQVRYVLSLSREFPEALQDLRNDKKMTFSLRLEQLERRFPGLYNLRITSVEVLPVALMDPTRFSLELTHLGMGQVRLKAQPDTAPGTLSPSTLNRNDLDIEADDWLRGLREQWPVKVRVTGPETAIFSGLSRQDLASLPSFFTANQRGAFEGLPGASAWELNMSMKENRLVPGTLADILITFTLSGYYESSLRKAIDDAPRKATATTTWFSAQRSFPDAFFQFNRSGRMDWDISPGFLSLNGIPDAVRNLSFLLQPAPSRPALGRLLCSYPVEFDVTSSGQVTIVTALPRVQLTTEGLILEAQTDFPSGTTATWDFGDGTDMTDSGGFPHTYSKPGRYEVMVRLAANGRLSEYRIAVVVSRDRNDVLSPLIAIPQLPGTVEGNSLKLRPSLISPASEPLSVTLRVDNQRPDRDSNPATFTIDLPTSQERTKRHVLYFAAVRPLKGRFYSKQRHVPGETIPVTGLHLSTNRTFEVGTDDETTATRNPFTRHLFGTSTAPVTLSPIDRWTLELPLQDNPAIVSVSSTDILQFDLSEISDAILAMEYKVRET